MKTESVHYEVEVLLKHGWEKFSSVGSLRQAKERAIQLEENGKKVQILKITRTEKTEVVG